MSEETANSRKLIHWWCRLCVWAWEFDHVKTSWKHPFQSHVYLFIVEFIQREANGRLIFTNAEMQKQCNITHTQRDRQTHQHKLQKRNLNECRSYERTEYLLVTSKNTNGSSKHNPAANSMQSWLQSRMQVKTEYWIYARTFALCVSVPVPVCVSLWLSLFCNFMSNAANGNCS